MSFEFEHIDGGWELTRYHEKRDVYRVDIPGRYRDEPVLRIGNSAFENTYLEDLRIPSEVEEIGAYAFRYCGSLCSVEFSEGLKKIGLGAFAVCEDDLISLTFPKSLESIANKAFESCWNLESVTFRNPKTQLGTNVFYYCLKLPAEIQLMNILCSCDITQPLPDEEYMLLSGVRSEGISPETDPLFREDVFTLAVKNKCFRTADSRELAYLLETLARNRFPNLLQIAVDGGLLTDGRLAEKLIEISTNRGMTELTAWLLEYKNRRFGFDGGDNFDL